MCGRFTLNEHPHKLAERFQLSGEPDLFASWNIAPSTRVCLIIADKDGSRHLFRMRWGLIPSWAKEAAIGNKLANARGETVAEKPSFRSAFKHRRCIIPASGFYEWKAEQGVKQPWYISLKSGEPMAFAGLWETWHPKEGEAIDSCCIITRAANSLMETIHDRMPVILDPEQWDEWLDPNLWNGRVSTPTLALPLERGCCRVSGFTTTASPIRVQGGGDRSSEDLNGLLQMLRPHESDSMQAWPVTRELNRVGLRDDAGLVGRFDGA
jgi:putative SOS response-associated peptidase YedK